MINEEAQGSQQPSDFFLRTQSKKAALSGGDWGGGLWVILSWDLEPENPNLNSISFTRPLTISEVQFLYLSTGDGNNSALKDQ